MAGEGQVQAVVVGVDLRPVPVHQSLQRHALGMVLGIHRPVESPVIARVEAVRVGHPQFAVVAVGNTDRHAHHRLPLQRLPRQVIPRQQPSHQAEDSGRGRPLPRSRMVGRDEDVLLVLRVRILVRELCRQQRASASRVPHGLQTQRGRELPLPGLELLPDLVPSGPVPAFTSHRHPHLS